MAGEPLDSLDEFFDFAQLEKDNNGFDPSLQYDAAAQAASFLGPDSAMDWQPSIGADMGAMDIPSEFSFSIPEDQTLSFFQADPMPPLVQDISMVPQTLTDHHSRTPSYSWQHHPMPREGEVITLRQETNQLVRPQRRNTVTLKPASAKRKGPSTRLPVEARQMLEEEFAANPYPCSWEIDIIAHQANLDVKRVRNWFNNTRARKKPESPESSDIVTSHPNGSVTSLSSRLSRDSLEALDKQADEVIQLPQPPLAVYLAQSYQEEAVPYSTIQAAMDNGNGSISDQSAFQFDGSSGHRVGRAGSVITSVTSSDGTAPTTYSSGSNMSSFGRARRRGRRRMEWKQSPYTRTKLNGLNSAGVPQENLPFCCTFCPRAFKTKYEWIRHEDSVHALRTTWICCDSKNVPLLSCPFCGQVRPDESHMASHKYQQCRNKPESQRTFYRRDHFIQHLHHVHFANVKHPSARLGCQTRLLDSEGGNFGCKDLALKWRRFGAPIKADDPMLCCGFCGKRAKDWSERCEHVAEHMAAGEWDRSTWWPERLENHLENLCSPGAAGPFRCRYCRKVFANVDAMNKHSHCRVWSCRFLRSFHVEHAQHYHRYRQCEQTLYTSEDEFLQHMHEFHGASEPQLLQGNSILEQNFSRNKGASFEPIQLDEIMQGCHVGDSSAMFVDPAISEKTIASTSSSSKTVRERPSTSTSRKAQQPVGPTGRKHTKTQRQRADSSGSKPVPQGPRFFRLSPLVPYLSTRIYYLRNAIPASLLSDSKVVPEEFPKSHVASLVMSSGLLGMAGVRFPVNMKRDGMKGPVEFTLEEDED
ncbi:homeodomain mating type protein alpha2 [Paraconiothyrium brasiliense]|uniref:Homeodomain mating type protein alpha2 n=1 Tax=Paraconiothyrium brasiliense TaxID=300254 RepID=A0ABR3R8G2_9PLEO